MLALVLATLLSDSEFATATPDSIGLLGFWGSEMGVASESMLIALFSGGGRHPSFRNRRMRRCVAGLSVLIAGFMLALRHARGSVMAESVLVVFACCGFMLGRGASADVVDRVVYTLEVLDVYIISDSESGGLNS